MKPFFTLLLTISVASITAQSIKDRIIHNDPGKYRELSGVHAGAGKMGFTQLIGRTDLSTNFLYLHAGTIAGKSGIGHHFHHNIEEMYVIFNGEAEFTINGRTSVIKAPAIVPCKMGDSHAIYNASDQPLRWLNFAVSRIKGRSDNFDLADDRVGVATDPIPVFVYDRLLRDRLKANDPVYSAEEVLFRRVFRTEVFESDWDHVDHVIIPKGKTSGLRQLEGIEEVYYVMGGHGNVLIQNLKASINPDDAFFAKLGETIEISNDGQEDLELLVIGISASKQKQLSTAKPLTEPKAMVLQMDFVVDKDQAHAFEKMYYSIYVPAMTVQQGYLSSKLLRLFPDSIAREIEAEPTTYNYQIQISFDTEESRRKWVASDQHQIAWPSATALVKEFKWRGYEVMGDDDQK
jgi:mannose-6-phosphate isomerase-like protein (cupin superfamily)/heme-degrading monooxygenase HmoA